MCFDKFNAKKKYQSAKNQLRLYKEKVRAGDNIDHEGVDEMAKQMGEADIRCAIENNQIELFRVQESRSKLEVTAKLRLHALEDLIRKEDKEIWKLSMEMESVKQLLEELNAKVDQELK
jgi:hypothetical protein